MKLRFQSSWNYKRKSYNVIELFSCIGSKKYEIHTSNELIFNFLERLIDGVNYQDYLNTIEQASNHSKSTIMNFVNNLLSLGVVIYGNVIESQIKNSIYDRQIRYFRTFENTICSGERLNELLQKRTVMIVGIGGYGSWILSLCARIGIRNIIGVDFDNIEISNLHRQIVYNISDVGRKKIDICKIKVNDSDPEITFAGHCLRIDKPEDLYPLLDQVDLVFNPFSYLPLAKAINHPAGITALAAMRKKISCLHFGGSWIGPLTIPGQTPCYFCAIKALELSVQLDPESKNKNIQKRAFAPPIAACCSIAVNEAARFLSGCDAPQILKGIIQLDVFNFSNSQFFNLTYNPSCDYCSSCILEEVVKGS